MEAVRRRWCRSQVVVVVRVVDGRRDSPLSRRREVHLVGLTLHCIRSHTIDFFYSPVLSITLSFPPLFLRLITSCLMGVRRGSEKPSQKFPSPLPPFSFLPSFRGMGKHCVCVLTAAALQSPCMLHHLPATTACLSGTWKPKLSPSVLGCGGDVYVCSSSLSPPLFLARLRVVGTDGGGAAAAAAGGGGERGGEQVHSHGSNYDWRGQKGRGEGNRAKPGVNRGVVPPSQKREDGRAVRSFLFLNGSVLQPP